VVLYNVPGRTGCDLLPGTVARLAPHPGIVGLKEARGDEPRWSALRPLAGPAFALLSGDDPTFVQAMQHGGATGVISVASNVVPATFRRLCDLVSAGDAGAAAALNARLAGLYEFLGVEPNPIPLKALLARQGIGHGLRLPLTPLTEANAAAAGALAAFCERIEHESP
jgi:4-hydroxy-tetrahydrodipicolinate synthase